MTNNQIKWLCDAATEKEKRYRGMVVGLQTVLLTLNETVLRFNSHYFRSDSDGMKLIAAKQLAIASLRQFRQALEGLYKRLQRHNELSEATEAVWATISPTLKRIDGFRDVRNRAFHFGDFLETADDLAAMYEEVEAENLDDLNAMLRELERFALQLRANAMSLLESETS